MPGLLRPAAPQHRLDPGDHLHHAEGLYQIVIRPEVKALNLVILRAPGCGHDDGNIPEIGRGLHPPQQGNTVLPRQHDVQQHQLRGLSLQSLPEGGSVLKAPGTQAGGVQGIQLDLPNPGIVLYAPDHTLLLMSE